MASALLDGGDMNTVHTKVGDWLQIIRGEYLEIPDLALTRAEARRMWSMDDMTCDALLDALVQARFLRFTRNKRYIRAGSGNEGT
jgi:hypothetical protein